MERMQYIRKATHRDLERLAEMSKAYGTQIEIDENGMGIVRL